MNWRDISSNGNPNDPVTQLRVSRHLASLVRYFASSKLELLQSIASGKTLLDIGAAGHVLREQLEIWPHEVLRRVSKSIVAVEIEVEACDYYNSLGYNFLNLDACSDAYIGRRFQVINCGDVIEHVDNSVNLMRFVQRHLSNDGVALISTPNPFYFGFSDLRSRRGEIFYTPNLSHVSWITPANMLEVLSRAGLKMEAVYVPEQSRALAEERSIQMETLFHEYIFSVSL